GRGQGRGAGGVGGVAGTRSRAGAGAGGRGWSARAGRRVGFPLMSDAPGRDRALELLGLLFQAHPWHGVAIGPEAPRVVTAYIEIVPTDTVKHEIHKASGHLKVDR